MHRLVAAAFCVLALSACNDDKKGDEGHGLQVWVRNVDDSDALSFDSAVDDSDALLMAAVHRGKADFGKGELGDEAPALTLVLAKYSAGHACIWARAFSTAALGTTTTVRLAAAPGGDFVVLLHGLVGALDLGDGALTGDVVARFSDDDGAPLWAVSVNDLLVDSTGADVAADATGDVFVVGATPQLTGDDGNPIIVPATALFVSKLDGDDGTATYALAHGSEHGNAQAQRVVVGPDGDIFLTGTFDGQLDLARALDSATYPTGTHYFMARLGDDGAPKWGVGLQALASTPRALELAVDDAGDVALLGSYQDPADVGDDDGSVLVNAKYKGDDGSELWREGATGDAATLVPGAVDFNGKGELYATASFRGSITVDGKSIPSGADRLVLAVLKRSSEDGGLVWSRVAVGGGNVDPGTASSDSAGNILAGGVFDKTTGDVTKREIFVVKLTP